MHILIALQSIFTIWMLADAAQRQAGYQWYIIIMMPFGPIIYFLMVKLNDPDMRALKRKLLTKKTTAKQIEYNARVSPSVHNKLLLAECRHDQGQIEEAAELFREVIASDPNDKRALHGLGVCLSKLEQIPEAIDVFERTIAADFSYSDYDACTDLATLYWEHDQQSKTVELLERVVKKSHRLSHVTQLAHYLLKLERKDEAKKLLERGLEDYQNSPRYVQKQARRWGREARKLLQLSAAS